MPGLEPNLGLEEIDKKDRAADLLAQQLVQMLGLVAPEGLVVLKEALPFQLWSFTFMRHGSPFASDLLSITAGEALSEQSARAGQLTCLPSSWSRYWRK